MIAGVTIFQVKLKTGSWLAETTYGTGFSKHLFCFEARVHLLPQMCYSALSI